MINTILFLTFFKIGIFTFGGGYAMLPLIQEEVLTNRWISEQTFIDFIAVSESTPGPFAVNIATYIGTEIGGILGAVCSTIGVALPSFIIILIVAKYFTKFKENKVLKWGMSGLRPGVIGFIGSAVISMGITVFAPHGIQEMFKNIEFYTLFTIFIISLILSFKKVHPIIIIFLSAILGVITGIIL